MRTALVVAGLWLAPISSADERAISELLAAEDARARERAAERLIDVEADVAVVRARLATGRGYPSDVATGLIERDREGTGGRHRYVILVPEDYDPTRSYRVCFYLHGGVNRSAPEEGGRWWRRFDRFDAVEQISVFPASWRGSLWWQPSQIENLAGILDHIKTLYNVDENRVFLFGVSDGGAGVYYQAMKAATPWAAFFPFITHPSVLSNPTTGVKGEMFEVNLANRPLYIVNGETDPLYPAARMLPYVEAFREEGARVVFRARPGGHNTRWWNGEAERIEAFMNEHARDPLPDRLVWETEDPEAFGRFSWLVIDELTGGSPAGGLFPHHRASGRVVVDRRGNGIEVLAVGVERFTLLLSPDELDFREPVRVTTNGVVTFDGMLTPSLETLLKWAVRDNDRTMLFTAELTLSVAPQSSGP